MKQMKMLALTVALVPVTVFAQNANMPPVASHARVQMDANRDGFIDRAEAARMPRLAARFDVMDKNRDGRLSANERPKGAHGKGKRGGHAGWLQRADSDKDGRISRAEAQTLPGKAGAHFDRMDFNKDGYVDRTDMQARTALQRAAFFAGADDNGDGRLSRDEFLVEQGARSAERREKWTRRAADKGKPAPMRPAPSTAQQIQRASMMFDRMDADKNGMLTRAEFDAAKSARHANGGRKR